jgi:hypothetical protein
MLKAHRSARSAHRRLQLAAAVGSGLAASIAACGAPTSQSIDDDGGLGSGEGGGSGGSSGQGSSSGRSGGSSGSGSGIVGSGAGRSSGEGGAPGGSGVSDASVRDVGGSSSGSSSSGSSGSGSSGSGSSGASSSGTCTTASGTMGWASRFWDCCKPSCSWSANVPSGNPAFSCNVDGTSHANANNGSACGGGNAYACYGFAPWSVSSTLSYGFAAYNGGSCGDCYQLTFTGKSFNGGNDPGSAALCGKQMVIQVVNIGGIASNQFDLMIPGGGVGGNSATVCQTQLAVSASALGATNGGFLTQCQGQSSSYPTQLACVRSMCAALPSGIQAGCNWFVDWYQAANNPSFTFQKVSCPSAITSMSGLH